MNTNGYEVEVWQEGGEWHATVYVTSERGERLEEVNGLANHEYLPNTMAYAAQIIDDYERGL